MNFFDKHYVSGPLFLIYSAMIALPVDQKSRCLQMWKLSQSLLNHCCSGMFTKMETNKKQSVLVFNSINK